MMASRSLLQGRFRIGREAMIERRPIGCVGGSVVAATLFHHTQIYPYISAECPAIRSWGVPGATVGSDAEAAVSNPEDMNNVSDKGDV